MIQRLILEYWDDDRWLVGRLRGIPGVFSQGQTLDELEVNIKDAYKLMFEEQESAPEQAKIKEIALEL